MKVKMNLNLMRDDENITIKHIIKNTNNCFNKDIASNKVT